MCPAFSPPLPSSSTSFDTKYLKPIPNSKNQTTTVMKTTIYSILAAAACGMAFGQTAYTTPVGYYDFAAVNGGNLLIPGLVKSAVFSGSLTAASSTTMTVAASSLTPSALNEGAVFATHYVEITQAGANQGVVIDIESNTASVITLASDISALSLAGTETITVRPHVTLKSLLLAAEVNLAPFTDSATFYLLDGNSVSYTYGGDFGTGWSSDFATADGNDRPVAPGTGFILNVAANVNLTLTGEVKASPTVVQLGAGVVNISGPVNPLAGGTMSLNATGWGLLTPFDDSVTVYTAGPLIANVSYSSLGDGNLSTDFSSETTDTINNTTGAVVIPAVSKSIRVNHGFTVAP